MSDFAERLLPSRLARTECLCERVACFLAGRAFTAAGWTADAVTNDGDGAGTGAAFATAAVDGAGAVAATSGCAAAAATIGCAARFAGRNRSTIMTAQTMMMRVKTPPSVTTIHFGTLDLWYDA